LNELVVNGHLRKADGVSYEREGYFDCRRDHRVYELTEKGLDELKRRLTVPKPEPDYVKGEEEL